MGNEKNEEEKDKIEEEKEDALSKRNVNLHISDKTDILNKSKNTNNSQNYENDIEIIDTKRSVGMEENIILNQNKNIVNEQNIENKFLDIYAEKLNLGKHLIYNYSDIEYRIQINKEKNNNLFSENLQTSPNADQGIN